jgi:hypothetical protein
MTDTLADALPREMARVRELIPIYALFPNGKFAIAMMQNALGRAEKAMMEDDVIRMVAAYAELKGFKE